MNKTMKKIGLIAAFITVATLVTWQATGGDAYTKFEFTEEVERKLDDNDPLAGTGFYDNDIVKETVTREEFRMGLIPTPAGLLDKHAISVLTIVGPTWGFTGVFWFVSRRRAKGSAQGVASCQSC